VTDDFLVYASWLWNYASCMDPFKNRSKSGKQGNRHKDRKKRPNGHMFLFLFLFLWAFKTHSRTGTSLYWSGDVYIMLRFTLATFLFLWSFKILLGSYLNHYSMRRPSHLLLPTRVPQGALLALILHTSWTGTRCPVPILTKNQTKAQQQGLEYNLNASIRGRRTQKY
jgi:hypothetical protein